jgi:hypothetical protein
MVGLEELWTGNRLFNIHRALDWFTSRLQGAFYIYLDTGPLLVASGSEDHEARVWDR